MTHWTLHELSRNATSLSFVIFERSIGGDLDPPGNRSELSVRMHVQNGRTEEITSNIEGFEGMSTLLRQRHHQGNVFPMKPHPSELVEVDAAREGQQSTDERFHSPLQMKLEGPGEPGWGRGLGGGWYLILFGIIATLYRHAVNDHRQVLEKRK